MKQKLRAEEAKKRLRLRGIKRKKKDDEEKRKAGKKKKESSRSLSGHARKTYDMDRSGKTLLCNTIHDYDLLYED